jgi:hypothetical protein
LAAASQFRIRNITASAALLDLLAVNGAGFRLTAGPGMPATVGPQKSVDFTVLFQPAGTGNYSASLDSVGIAVLLTATVPVELTCLLGSQPLGAAPVDFGTVPRGTAVLRHVTLANQTSVPLIVPAISVTGAGFSLSGAMPTGAQLKQVASAGFDVQFSPAAVGAVLGVLEIGDRSYVLQATGIEPAPPPELTYSLGSQPLGVAPVDFGTVERGSAVLRHVTVMNDSGVPLTVPAISATGAGFALSGATSTGLQLKPAESTGFDAQFSPAAAGAAVGALTIGDNLYALEGMGVEPPLPAPRVAVALAQALSAQQGSITVNFDAPSKTSGSGTVTLAFQAAAAGPKVADPAIALATGGQAATFTVSPGDTQGHFGAQASVPFQTGTTAGTLTIVVELGELTDRQTVTIAPTAVGLTGAAGLRAGGGVELDLTGFDNTRTAGPLTFTFFDAAGNAIAGVLAEDGSADFASYFQSSAGGGFVLKAVFPVSGDASQIKAFEASVGNSVGTSKTGRVSF